MDNREVATFLGAVTAVWPSFDVSEQRIKIMRALLKDKNYTDAMHALNLLAHTLDGDFAPSIPTLLKAVAKISAPEAERLGSEEALRLVGGAVQKFGRYREGAALKSLPPKVSAAVRSIGWQAFCNTEDDDLPSLRAHFYRTFNAVAERVTAEKFIPDARQQRIESSEIAGLINGATRSID